MSSEILDFRTLSLNSRNGYLLNDSLKSNISFYVYNLHPFKDVTRISMRMRNATIPNFFYNIIDQTLTINYNTNISAQEVLISIPNGIYNIYSLLHILNSLIAQKSAYLQNFPISSLLNFSYNKEINRVIITTGHQPGQTLAQSQLPILSLSSSSGLLQKLGFYDAYFPTLFNNVQVARSPPDISGVNTIFLLFNELATNNYSSELSSTYFAKIPINSQIENTQTYSFNDDRSFFVSPSSLHNNLTASLYDQFGNILDFQGYDWSVTIEICFYRTGMTPHGDIEDTLQQISSQLQENLDNQSSGNTAPDASGAPAAVIVTDQQMQQIQNEEMPDGIRQMWEDLQLASPQEGMNIVPSNEEAAKAPPQEGTSARQKRKVPSSAPQDGVQL